MTRNEVIDRAINLLRQGWTKETFAATSPDGGPMCFCLDGALRAAAGGQLPSDEHDFFKPYFDGSDGRTHFYVDVPESDEGFEVYTEILTDLYFDLEGATALDAWSFNDEAEDVEVIVRRLESLKTPVRQSRLVADWDPQ